MSNIKSLAPLIVAATASTALAMGEKPRAYVPKVKDASLRLIRAFGTPDDARYMADYTAAVRKALAGSGFSVTVVEPATEGSLKQDRLSVSGASHEEYCLEAAWEVRGPEGRKGGGEVRVPLRPDWVKGAMQPVSASDCAREFANRLLVALQKANL